MGSTTNPFKEQPHSITKKFLPWTLYLILPVALVHFYLFPIPLLSSTDQLPSNSPVIIQKDSSSPPPPPPSPPPAKDEARIYVENRCDYTNGKWVQDKLGALYNGTNCGTIKDGQNCMRHGRPDIGYLYWRWRPNQCKLSRFEPDIFFRLLKNKHLAFVGDSMARNQMESLLCMLATASSPDLVYIHGEENKFRRWHFASHNATVSIYWSPFLVKGMEKSKGVNHNRLFLDSVDEKWASEMDGMDIIILSIGHWYLHPAVYYYGDKVLGCHYCFGQNYTEIRFLDVFGKAFNTTLKAIIDRRGASENGIDVIVTTFSPAHFEGDWDKFGACNKTKPYEESEKKLEGMDADMRDLELKEVKEAKAYAKQFGTIRLEAVDVTKLSLLRPDGHPGPYMYPNPFADGISDRVQNDCVHWCLPGPVDTWNEILLDVMKRWKSQSSRA